jgi:hypothetical protein
LAERFREPPADERMEEVERHRDAAGDDRNPRSAETMAGLNSRNSFRSNYAVGEPKGSPYRWREGAPPSSASEDAQVPASGWR